MKKKILVRGPALSRSGYGEHTRFLLRSLRAHEDKCDLFLINIPWGQTGCSIENDEERHWMDALMLKTAQYLNQKGSFDASLQVTIPNEWEKIAPINIGVTAGIETTKVAPIWLAKANEMDKVIVVSNHSKQVFETTVCNAQNAQTGEQIENYRCETPIEVVNYPARIYKPEKIIGLDLEFDFNFLTIAQWGPRKNLDNTIKWFVEEFRDKEVGLVVKTNTAKDSLIDRRITENRMRTLLGSLGEKKCKIYLLHGYLTAPQMTGLYTNKKIKALVSATHGEGFGLPLFEAACNGLPIIAPLWSGHVDFLYAPNKNGKMRPQVAKIGYTMQPVQKENLWEGVIEEGAMWCYPYEKDYKKALESVFTSYPRFKSMATRLKKYVLKEFASGKQHKLFADEIFECVGESHSSEEWLSEIEDIIKEYE